jgi:hypothetical protein
MSEKGNDTQIKYADLTEEQKKELFHLIAKAYVEIDRKIHREFMKQVFDDLFTPFWVRWARSLKKKLFKKNENKAI